MIKSKIPSWIPFLGTAFALAVSASLCQAQTTITLSNDSSQSPAFYASGPAGATYTWQSTGGPNGGGCIKGVIDGVTTMEFDPSYNVSFTSGQYYEVTLQMKVDPASGTTGTSGSGGYGNLQLGMLDPSYTWTGIWIGAIYPPAASDWVTYVFSIPSPSTNVAHLQFQLQASSAYSAPVTIYLGNVTILPVPNPNILAVFTNDTVTAGWNNYGLAASWDGNIDAPYTNPVNGAGPTDLTPAGSISFQSSSPKDYQGGQLNTPFNPAQYQSLAFDVYYDGPTSPTSTNYAGFQLQIADGNPPYHWIWIGSLNFTANMIGKWTHVNLPCASSGVLKGAGLAFQSTPGNQGTNAIDPIVFHVDNIQVWNPVTVPVITSITPGTFGGVQFTLDGNGLLNTNDQEGITSPATNNANTDYFWLNQTPASYSFTLTNFPSPASAPQFDGHIYICNGDSITAFNNLFDYNQTYSGAPYNMVDYLGLHVQNATNGGVVAIVDWKTNAPNTNPTNNTYTFHYSHMASANGTWTLSFSDNTHGSVTAADGSVSNFTLPDFINDPNYNANFTPISSMVQFGVYKNGNPTNNNQTYTMTSEGVTNSATTLFDNFKGPGLTANNNWQVAEYYQYSAIRAVWQPAGTAFWLKWNTSAGGWGVQSTSNLLSSWGSAGVTYTYPDSTGTNTVGAVPASNLPSAGSGFFRLVK